MSNTKQKTALKLCEVVPGLKIKMQPFIDSDAWVYGVVQSVDKDWIYVQWHVSDYVTISESHLPEERQNIIDAYIDGQSRHDDASEKWAEQYFNENYL